MVHTSLRTEGPAGLLRILLRGVGQVMFQNNAWSGLLFLTGIGWGAWQSGLGILCWGALAGLLVSTAAGWLLGLPEREGEQGLWGFNGVLVGCALPASLGNTGWMWLALLFCAALTTWVRTGLNNVAAPWRINSLTFPFVLCTWLFLLAARALGGLPPLHAADLALSEPVTPAAGWHLADLLCWWLRGIAQIFLLDSWVTGLLFLAGLLAASWRAALWGAIGSAAGLLLALLFGASGAKIAAGLYGYSPALTAIALATVFYRPGWRSALWALTGIAATFFVQAGLGVLLAPVGLTALTAPFCLATWLFLLPLLPLDDHTDPDHSNWEKPPGRPPVPAPPHR